MHQQFVNIFLKALYYSTNLKKDVIFSSLEKGVHATISSTYVDWPKSIILIRAALINRLLKIP